MKFDKLMEFCYKFIIFAVACCVVVGFCVSCFKPVTARAEISASDFAQIQTYLENAQQNENAIDFQLSTDQDGNRSVRLQIKTLQDSYFKMANDFYNQQDFNLSTAPNDITFSGSSTAGIYQSAIDGNFHSVTNCAMSAPGSMFFSDEFNVVLSLVPASGSAVFTPYSSPSGFIKGANVSGDYQRFVLTDTGGYFTTLPHTITPATSSVRIIINDYSASGFEPLSRGYLTPGTIGGFFNGNGMSVGKLGVTVTLPEDTVPTATPWDYYNDDLLPYIRENFDIPNLEDYLIFPDGYSAPNGPINPDFNTPVVVGGGVAAGFVFAPIILGAGAIVDLGGLNFDIFAPIDDFLRVDGIDFSFPVDKSVTNAVNINGVVYDVPTQSPVTVIDSNGVERTVIFTDINHFTIDGIPFVRNLDGTITIDNNVTIDIPTGVPETLASDVNSLVYAYELPTLEHLEIIDATFSAPDLSDYADNISAIWTLTKKIYTDSGLLSPLLICLSLSLIGYGLWKIAG